VVGWAEWAEAIKQRAGDRSVVFVSSYQLPSQYTFYSGEQGHQFNALNNDGSQFTLWNLDDDISGKPYTFAIPYGDNDSKALRVEGFPPIYIWDVEDYHSYRNLRFEFTESQLQSESGEEIEIHGSIFNGTDNKIRLDSLLNERKLSILYYANKKDTVSFDITCQGCETILQPSDSYPISLKFRSPEKEGKYLVRFGLGITLGLVEQNSDYIPLEVTDK
jgi:hypothetical protein